MCQYSDIVKRDNIIYVYRRENNDTPSGPSFWAFKRDIFDILLLFRWVKFAVL